MELTGSVCATPVLCKWYSSRKEISEAALFSVVLKARGHGDNVDTGSFLMDLKIHF